MSGMIPYPAFLRALVRVGIVAAILGIYWGFRNPALLDAAGNFYGHDFINYWAAPFIARIDMGALFSIEAYNARLAEHYGTPLVYHNWSYPPHTLLLLDPLSRLPHNFAFVVWSGLGLWAYLWCIHKLAGSHGRKAIGFALLSPALILNLFLGQNGFFIAALFLAALMYLNRRPHVSGALLGVLTIKPHLGVVWPLLLLAQWRIRTAVVAALTSAALIGVSAAVYGIEIWENFFAVTAPYQATLITQALGRVYEHMMASWPLTLLRFGAPFAIGIAVHAMVAAYVLVTLARVVRKEQELSLLAVRVCCAAMIVTPYLFNYDMTLLSAALIARFVSVPDMALHRRIAYGAAHLLPALVYWLYALLPLAPLVLLCAYISALRENTTPRMTSA